MEETQMLAYRQKLLKTAIIFLKINKTMTEIKGEVEKYCQIKYDINENIIIFKKKKQKILLQLKNK